MCVLCACVTLVLFVGHGRESGQPVFVFVWLFCFICKGENEIEPSPESDQQMSKCHLVAQGERDVRCESEFAPPSFIRNFENANGWNWKMKEPSRGTDVEYLRLFRSRVAPASKTPGGDAWPSSRFCSVWVGSVLFLTYLFISFFICFCSVIYRVIKEPANVRNVRIVVQPVEMVADFVGTTTTARKVSFSCGFLPRHFPWWMNESCAALSELLVRLIESPPPSCRRKRLRKKPVGRVARSGQSNNLDKQK